MDDKGEGGGGGEEEAFVMTNERDGRVVRPARGGRGSGTMKNRGEVLARRTRTDRRAGLPPPNDR